MVCFEILKLYKTIFRHNFKHDTFESSKIWILYFCLHFPGDVAQHNPVDSPVSSYLCHEFSIMICTFHHWKIVVLLCCLLQILFWMLRVHARYCFSLRCRKRDIYIRLSVFSFYLYLSSILWHCCIFRDQWLRLLALETLIEVA